MQKIKLLPGNMIVELESRYKNTGVIQIPERYKHTPHLIGIIKQINMRPIDIRTLGHEIKVGQRVIVSHAGGRYLDGNEWIYSITVTRRDARKKKYQDSIVLAIAPDSVNLAPHTQDIERCQFCGEAKSGSRQNIILCNGKCPRCGRNTAGDILDESPTVDDADVEAFFDAQQRATSV